MKIIFWINEFFLFSSQDETKVRIIWRKMAFHPGMKVSFRGQLAGMKFHPRMKYLKAHSKVWDNFWQLKAH